MSKNLKFVGGACAVLVIFLSGAELKAATALARVNGWTLSLDEFNRKYKDNLKYFPGKPPSKKDVLNDIIRRELGIQEAKKLGLDKDAEVVDRMNTVLFQALIDRKLAKEFESIHVTDSDAKSYYSKNPEIRTSHIFVAVGPGSPSPSEEKKALEKITKIQNDQLKPGKMGFAEVAQKFSEGTAAPMGGDLDYKTKQELDPAYWDAAMKLRPGQTSGIVRSRFGYHIIKLTAIRDWDDADKARVKQLAITEKQAQAFDRYMQQLRSQGKVAVNAELLKE